MNPLTSGKWPYGQEALAAESLALEHNWGPLSLRDPPRGRHRGVASFGRPRLFETSVDVPQPWLFGLEAPGETGWLKTLRLEGYAPRRPRGLLALQQALFPCTEAL